ncbi:hypothetical protein GYMLUDRAFT_44528 [Collybiopsis luxurians FD-317 M1]|uniref:Unplaced genomic scaffold GYMLUscaffold_31, whole genome shotgun sequence n=1 Tax=Collybiopsis luxurians FD-317 M1 TaxID=944289 RepID=A0A0D0BVL7_9AGAR|nr:hypothetical protein GYMLUDRAFT_44528 [Collybiopsis luxurians FD-317 M1]
MTGCVSSPLCSVFGASRALYLCMSTNLHGKSPNFRYIVILAPPFKTGRCALKAMANLKASKSSKGQDNLSIPSEALLTASFVQLARR